MKEETTLFEGNSVKVISVNTLLVGSGAASLNAAISLWEGGVRDILIVTEQWGGGTSNNAGSDKQTYYKLSLDPSRSDSALEMARDLFNGGCMHGDIALCEAQYSLPAFFHLTRLGVPFPHDTYGAYPGYVTDHDRKGRATSAGPLTSHLMFEKLAAKVVELGIPVKDRSSVIALLVRDDGGKKAVTGAVLLNTDPSQDENREFILINAVNVILGTGGPAGLYRDSVYPESQVGSIGLALRIGATAQNLTESQFGLGSVKFRWNLSGSYQQVIPRYFSTDQNGEDEQDFLNPFSPDTSTLLNAIFLKGYQWPFDPRKIEGFGSSMIDLLVYRESALLGRRVYMDYTRNPENSEKDGALQTTLLPEVALTYWKRSSVNGTRPIDRLAQLNQPAIDWYRKNGIDLYHEPIEIAVCAQHNNGGLSADIWWESNIRHLFPLGEVCGTHGVYRPGGSALNSGQVGGIRASMRIAEAYRGDPQPTGEFLTSSMSQIDRLHRQINSRQILPESQEYQALRGLLRKRMSERGGHIRDSAMIHQAMYEAWEDYKKAMEMLESVPPESVPHAFQTLDLLLTHAVYLEAIGAYIDQGGRSRGSYLIIDTSRKGLKNGVWQDWKVPLNRKNSFVEKHILELCLDDQMEVHKEWVPIRPIPEQELWFEQVWKEYREAKRETREKEIDEKIINP